MRMLFTTGTATGRPEAVTENQTSSPVRVLVIADMERLGRRMDRNLYQRYEALGRCPGVRVTGPGCEGFSRGMPVADLFDGAGDCPDLLIHGPDLGATGRPLVGGLADLRIPKAMQIVDSWELPAIRQQFLRSNHFDYVFHVARPREPEYERACPEVQFIWTPNAVQTDVFRDYGHEKVNDVLFYGAAYDWYPLRARALPLLEGLSHNSLRVKIIPHPGYWDDGYTPQPDHYVGRALAEEINRSWITITTASVHGCLFVKHLEAPAAMSLPAGSVPDQARPLLGDGILDLAALPDEAIIESLTEALADKGRLLARIAEASDRVREHCSMECCARDTLYLVERLVRPNSPASRSDPEQEAPAYALPALLQGAYGQFRADAVNACEL